MTEQREAQASYTIRDVAAYYGVPVKAVRRWIKSGDLIPTRGPWMSTNYSFTAADLRSLETVWARRKAEAAAS